MCFAGPGSKSVMLMQGEILASDYKSDETMNVVWLRCRDYLQCLIEPVVTPVNFGS